MAGDRHVYSYTYGTEIGYIRITADDGTITNIDLDVSSPVPGEAETPLLHAAYIQLTEYLSGQRRYFDLPLNPAGTAFQKKVWSELQKIPYGRTRSYREIASAAGNIKACRAVGGANGANPIPIIIPCHRVISADGTIGGYSGGTGIKKKLLELEAKNIRYFSYGKKETDYLKLRDAELGQVIDSAGRLDYEVIPDLYAALVNSILSQQISSKAFATVWDRLKNKIGDITPENIDKTPTDAFRNCGISQKKSLYIKDAAAKILSGEFYIAELKSLPDNEVIKRLITLRGVGVWTAEMLLIFSLERSDVLSFGDFGIRRGICRLHGHETLDKETFENYRRLYSPYGTVASFYLWYAAKS
jgi:O-6-methylguanine DNA methyltransferase